MQRYFAKDKKQEYLILELSDLHHIKNVMRNKEGDSIECIYQERLYICQIQDCNSPEVKIIEEKTENNENHIDIAIAIALVKEQKMDLILQKLTELGISTIIPLQMEHSIVKLDATKFQKKKERWEKICKEAAEQSKRNRIPTIMNLTTIKQLQDCSFDQKFICSTRNQQNLINNYLQRNSSCAKMIFVIGPEGGISPKEEEQLENFGFLPISLGKRIMRVETAAIYVASIANFCSME